jgi:hypothetical protein
MAYLVLRTSRIVSRISPAPSFTSKCVRSSPSILTHRANSTFVSSADVSVDDAPLPRPIDRSHETPDITRARLLYQSRKRGILETDLLLSTFAHKHLATMSETEMREYDKVITHTVETDKAVIG